MAVFYAAAVALVIAWLGVGTLARRGQLGRGRCAGVLAAWGVPLLVAPPLFSRDVYSYMAQGLLADRGLDPYVHGPAALGHGYLLASVATPWRATPAPYGPLFIGMARLASDVFGRSIALEVTVFRLIALLGVILLIVCLPRLARRSGAEPDIALWLAVLSPLALFSFVASGHNDALMVGLMAVGLTLLLGGRTAWALGFMSLAGTVKVSAFAGVVLVAVFVWRSESPGLRFRRLPGWAAAVAAPIVGTTLLSGEGWGWLTPKVLQVPGHLLLGYAPAPAVGLTIFHGLHLVGVHLARSTVVTAAEASFALLGLVLAALLARGARDRDGIVLSLGFLMLALVLAGPSLWPWYLTWSVTILAITRYQGSRILVGGAVLTPFLVAPAGTPILRGPDYVVVAGLVVAGAVWAWRARPWRALEVAAIA